MRRFRSAVFVAVLVATLTAFAQEDGYWRASSQTARSITGDVSFSGEKLTMNFLLFPISKIRPLANDEVNAAFNPDPGTSGNGSLFRLSIPSSQKLLHKNTLCGSDDTAWMVTFISGRTLEIKFFSGQKPPALTSDALADSSDLCGTYVYSR